LGCSGVAFITYNIAPALRTPKHDGITEKR